MSRNKSGYQSRQPTACCIVLWCFSKNNLSPKNPYPRCDCLVTDFCFSGWKMLYTCRVFFFFFCAHIVCITMFSFCVKGENLSFNKRGIEIRLKEQVLKLQSKSLNILKSIYKVDKKEVWKLVEKGKKKEQRYNMKF